MQADLKTDRFGTEDQGGGRDGRGAGDGGRCRSAICLHVSLVLRIRTGYVDCNTALAGVGAL